MFRSLFQALFGSFFRYQSPSNDELALVRCMISETQVIENGSYTTKNILPKPTIPERRKEMR